MTAAEQLTPADELFLCQRGGGNGPPCRMLKRACVERQTRRQRKRGRVAAVNGGRRFEREVAVHPFCAGGTCEQGAAIAAEVGDLPARGPVRLPSSFGTVPHLAELAARARAAAALPAAPPHEPAEEVPMAKCNVCKERELHPTRNKTGICGPCQEKGHRKGGVMTWSGKPPKGDGKPGPSRGTPAPRRERVVPPVPPGPETSPRPVVKLVRQPEEVASLTNEQLLELRGRVDAEIHARISRAEAELRAMRDAVARAADAAREASGA